MTLFRQEALDHKRRKLFGEVILIQPLGFFITTAVFFFLTLLAAWFLSSREYIRKETVIGYIAPSSGVTVIRADRGGRMVQMFGAVGMQVDAGMPLFESRVDVDTTDGYVSERQLRSTDVRLSELREQTQAITERYAAEARRLVDQIANIERELAGLDRRQGLQAEAVDVSGARRTKMDRLLANEVVSQIEAEQARSDDINQNLALESIAQQIVSRQGVLSEARYARRAVIPARDRELSQLRQQIAQLEESRTALQASASYVVRSPVSGIITALQGNVGQSLNPNVPVIVIVPEGAELMATLLVPTRSAGFIQTGQDVNLLVDAFPYQKFGVQTGQVTEISETPYRPGELDAPVPYEQPVYRVKVSLMKSTVTAYGDEVSLKPGMTLQGDVITDRRSLIEWMLDPLFSLKRT